MKNIDFEMLLRYAYSGSALLFMLLIGFNDVRQWLTTTSLNAVSFAGLVGFSLTLGSVVYSLHRAILFPVLYVLTAKLRGRSGSALEMDLLRWVNGSKQGAIQSRLGEWGAQVHFLYCICWTTILATASGWLLRLEPSEEIYAVFVFGIFFFVSAFVHHWRYQKWEKAVFDHDQNLSGIESSSTDP